MPTDIILAIAHFTVSPRWLALTSKSNISLLREHAAPHLACDLSFIASFCEPHLFPNYFVHPSMLRPAARQIQYVYTTFFLIYSPSPYRTTQTISNRWAPLYTLLKYKNHIDINTLYNCFALPAATLLNTNPLDAAFVARDPFINPMVSMRRNIFEITLQHSFLGTHIRQYLSILRAPPILTVAIAHDDPVFFDKAYNFLYHNSPDCTPLTSTSPHIAINFATIISTAALWFNAPHILHHFWKVYIRRHDHAIFRDTFCLHDSIDPAMWEPHALILPNHQQFLPACPFPLKDIHAWPFPIDPSNILNHTTALSLSDPIHTRTINSLVSIIRADPTWSPFFDTLSPQHFSKQVALDVIPLFAAN